MFIYKHVDTIGTLISIGLVETVQLAKFEKTMKKRDIIIRETR